MAVRLSLESLSLDPKGYMKRKKKIWAINKTRKKRELFLIFRKTLRKH